LFTVRDFGGPFESILEARLADRQLHFTTRLRTTMTWVYFVILVATVWPGVWLTDSMLRTYFTGYDYLTWMWYLPLTAPFVPWAMWAAIRKSRVRGRTEAAEIIASIRKLLA